LKHAGAAVIPRQLVEPYVKRRRLHTIRTGRAELIDAIWLHERRGAYQGAALLAFRTALLEEFAS
jgi:DNA-binding transcriptional LysR family regulator